MLGYNPSAGLAYNMNGAFGWEKELVENVYRYRIMGR
jgi:hypothetical protein